MILLYSTIMPVSGLCGPVIVQMKYFSPKDMPQTIRGKVFPRPSDSVLNSLRFCFSFQGGKKRRKEGKHMQPISELASICVALSCSRRSDGCLFLQLPYLSGMIASFFFFSTNCFNVFHVSGQKPDKRVFILPYPNKQPIYRSSAVDSQEIFRN